MTDEQRRGLCEVLALIESARRSIVTAKDGVHVERLLSAAELSLFVSVSELRTILECGGVGPENPAPFCV